MLNEQHRTVKEQLEQLRVKKSTVKLPQEMERSKLRSEKAAQSLALDPGQRKRLQQQMQQVSPGPVLLLGVPFLPLPRPQGFSPFPRTPLSLALSKPGRWFWELGVGWG